MESRDALAAQLLAALDDLPLSVLVIDRTWTYVYANPAAHSLLDEPEDLAGRSARGLHADGVPQRLRAACARVMRGGERELVEAAYERLGVSLRARVMPWRDGIVLFIGDITEQRRSEVAALRAFDLYSQILDHAPTAISLLGLDGRYRLVSKSAAQLMGRPVEEVLDRSPEELFEPDVAAEVLGAHRTACERGEVVRMGGVESWQAARGLNVLSEVFPVYDARQQLMGSGAAVTDVTQLARAEAEREAAQRRYRAVFSSSSLGQLVVQMKDGAVLEANAAVCRLLGYSRPKLLTMHARDVVEGGDAAWGRRRARLLAEGELGYETEDVLRRSDGRGVPVLATMNLLPPTELEGQLLLMVVRDQTLEKELREQLLAAERLEAAGRVAAGVVHDANNVLMGVSSYAEMLLQEATTPAARRYVDGIFHLVDRGRAMTAGLMQFTRAQSLQPSDVDLRALVEDVLEMLRQLLPDGSHLHVDLAPAITLADGTEVTRVLMNLVLNAGEALSDGGRVEITTSLRTVVADAVLPAGLYGVLTVRDDGVGMDDTVLRRCFEPFFTTRGRSGGTGLGLSTAHGIARQSGGDLRAASAPGEGTTFELLLPAGAAQEAVGGDVASEGTSTAESRP